MLSVRGQVGGLLSGGGTAWEGVTQTVLGLCPSHYQKAWVISGTRLCHLHSGL